VNSEARRYLETTFAASGFADKSEWVDEGLDDFEKRLKPSFPSSDPHWEYDIKIGSNSLDYPDIGISFGSLDLIP
jgi:hypothetical protein